MGAADGPNRVRPGPSGDSEISGADTAGTEVNNEQGKRRWFFGLAALEAGAAFVALALLPREGQIISAARALMLGVLALFFFAGIALALRPPHWLALLQRPSVIFSMALLSLLVATALFLLRYLDPSILLPFYQRLEPLLWYLLVLGIQTTLLLLVRTYGFHREGWSERSAARRPVVIALCGLTLVSGVVALTRWGLAPDSAYWGEPGVPILGWQLALVLVAGLALLLAGFGARLPARVDLILSSGVWLFAVVIWLSVPAPVTRNSFYAPMTPPANQPFPNSDAGYYDSMAESLLIGQPYQGEIPTRPLYILVLTIEHLLVGEDYALIVVGQTLLLALIPVVLYWLGRALHSRTAGLMAALIATFREWTTVLVSSQTRVSDSRTLLVDLPTLLLILVACLLSVRWLIRRDLQSGLLAGGVFGMLLLLRTQSLLIAPFLLLVVIVATGLRRKRWIMQVLLFGAALAATATPWLVHNYVQTGQLTLDAPFQYQIIASQYQYTGNLEIGNIDLRGKSVAGILVTFLVHDPRFVLGFVATHFLSTEINGLLALPLFHDYRGLAAPIDIYWLNWQSQLSAANVTLLAAYLVTIAVGIGAAWRQGRWAGLMPLVFSLGYALANGIGRFSGWRYDLPSDWISYFYFSLGVAEIFSIFALVLGASSEKLSAHAEHTALRATQPRSALLIIVAFALMGSLPWLAERLGPARYTDQDPARLVASLSASSAASAAGIDTAALASLASSQSGVVQTGRLLYPRFFSRNLGLASAHPWPAYAPREFPRLGFLLLNQTRHDIVFPTRQVDGPFTQGADVIIVGCQRADYVEARLVYFPEMDALYSSAALDQPCQ